jgi:hypothetical protein
MFYLQNDRRLELYVISQPEGMPLSSVPGYVYEETAGRGITVYIMDFRPNIASTVSTLSNLLKG